MVKMMLFRVMLDNGDVFMLNFHRDVSMNCYMNISFCEDYYLFELLFNFYVFMLYYTKIPPKENLNLHKFGAEMDPTKIPPSFLTFIGEEPVFLTIPSDFATNLWGDKVPYGKTVKIRDGNSLRCVRIRKRNGEPIFTDGWFMLVRENDLKSKDGVLITATGPYTFNVSCFKEFVCQNSYFTAQINDVPYMTLMPDKFWNNFYGKNYKGEMARVYVGQRFWNVKLEASSHCCCFKDGWLKLVEEVPLENEPYLVFTMIDLKTFELSVFDPESGTEMVLKKDDVVNT
ncbi:putative transcription factor B3-Domain family [Helianthus annuus]|nr:putative transcription factor B3-Domain family [Helianthus annuus]